ncbi:unnamed protein product, partial [Closterium sp. NIES-54]
MAANHQTTQNQRDPLSSSSRRRLRTLSATRRRASTRLQIHLLVAALFLPALALAVRPQFATDGTRDSQDSVVIARYQAGLSKMCLGASRERARAVIGNADYAGSDANVAMGYSQATNATFMYIGGAKMKVPSALQVAPQVTLDVSNMYPTALEVDAAGTVSAPPMTQANFTVSGADLSPPADPYGMVSSYLEQYGAKADANDLSGAILVTYDPYIEAHVTVYMIYRPVYSPAAVVQQYCNSNAPCYFAYEMIGKYAAPQD